MPWPFGSGLSGSDKAIAVALIRHCQTMFAYQQLAMERYNDALAFATGAGTPTNEGLYRPQADVADPTSVIAYVLPALEEKVGIFGLMEGQHRAAARPTETLSARVYDECTSLISVLQQRTALQHQGFVAWSNDPALDVGDEMTRLDSAENAALNQSAASLNELIAKVGMKREAWLQVNCAAFNTVRASIGLPPMTDFDFQRRFAGGMMGMPARFFTD